MQPDRNERRGETRRDLLKQALATGAATSFPWVVPARALGRGGAVAPGEKITLGVIGIGPRCTYDLQSILALPDVQCVAICDVQASRREAGKTLVVMRDLYPSKEVLDEAIASGSTAGMGESFDQLDELLVALGTNVGAPQSR